MNISTKGKKNGRTNRKLTKPSPVDLLAPANAWTPAPRAWPESPQHALISPRHTPLLAGHLPTAYDATSLKTETWLKIPPHDLTDDPNLILHRDILQQPLNNDSGTSLSSERAWGLPTPSASQSWDYDTLNTMRDGIWTDNCSMQSHPSSGRDMSQGTSASQGLSSFCAVVDESGYLQPSAEDPEKTIPSASPRKTTGLAESQMPTSGPYVSGSSVVASRTTSWLSKNAALSPPPHPPAVTFSQNAALEYLQSNTSYSPGRPLELSNTPACQLTHPVAGFQQLGDLKFGSLYVVNQQPITEHTLGHTQPCMEPIVACHAETMVPTDCQRAVLRSQGDKQPVIRHPKPRRQTKCAIQALIASTHISTRDSVESSSGIDLSRPIGAASDVPSRFHIDVRHENQRCRGQISQHAAVGKDRTEGAKCSYTAPDENSEYLSSSSNSTPSNEEFNSGVNFPLDLFPRPDTRIFKKVVLVEEHFDHPVFDPGVPKSENLRKRQCWVMADGKCDDKGSSSTELEDNLDVNHAWERLTGKKRSKPPKFILQARQELRERDAPELPPDAGLKIAQFTELFGTHQFAGVTAA